MIMSSHSTTDATPERLLAVLPGWVGDTVLATPALAAIRRRWPDARVTILGKPHLLDLLADGGFADDAISWSHGARRDGRMNLPRLAAHVRSQSFDTAVLFPNSFRSALLCFLARIPRRIGYARDGRSLLLTDRLRPVKERGEFVPISMVDSYNKLAQRLGCEEVDRRLRLGTSERDDAAVGALLQRLGVAERRPLVIVHTGASFGSAKCWLPERFAEVADRLIEDHEATVALSCGPNEVESVPRIAEMMKRSPLVLNDPLLSIGELKALVRRSDLLVTNDTGPRHFPVAFGLPVVTIFGSTDPRWTEANHPLERKLMISVECGPCMKRICPLGHHDCMKGVTTDMVIRAATELLATRRAAWTG